MSAQLDFFLPDLSDIDCLRIDVETVKYSSDKVRKSIFARHGELARKYMELHERLQILERNICLGNVKT
jgi:hypothetical protein